MLLRRVIDHVKQQNWTAVGIDFVIVVVGVFIGIQVSNWNAARADRGTVVRHLGEIAEDLQSHLEFHDLLYRSALARIAAVDYLYSEAFDQGLPPTLVLSTERFEAPPTMEVPPEALDNLMGWINLVRITVSSRSGYEALISSGNLRLIENRELARSIQQYYGSYDDLLDTQSVFRRFRNDGSRQFYELGLSVFGARPASELVTLTRENEAFAAYLRTTREWAILHAALLDRLRSQTEGLLGEIDSELQRLR